MMRLFLVFCVLLSVKVVFADTGNCDLVIPKVPHFEVSEVTVVEALQQIEYSNCGMLMRPNVMVISGSLKNQKLSLAKDGLDLLALATELLELSGEKYYIDDTAIWVGVDQSEVLTAKSRYPEALEQVVIPQFRLSRYSEYFDPYDASKVMGLLWDEYNQYLPDWDLEVTLRNEELPELTCRHLGFRSILAFYDLCAGNEEFRPVVVLRINQPKE